MHYFSIKKYSKVSILLITSVFLTVLSLTYFAIASEQTITQRGNNSTLVSTLEFTDQDISEDYIFKKKGIASYYGKRFHKRRTANGERFDMYALTAAHRKLPFGSIIRVTNLKTNKNVILRINDRGPYVGKRIIDLSYAAAKEIDGVGLPKVKLEALINKKKSKNKEGHFFAYSYDKPLLCLKKDNFHIVDTLNNFDTALDEYNSILIKDNSEEVYLMVETDYVQHKKTNYYIGYRHTIFENYYQNYAQK